MLCGFKNSPSNLRLHYKDFHHLELHEEILSFEGKNSFNVSVYFSYSDNKIEYKFLFSRHYWVTQFFFNALIHYRNGNIRSKKTLFANISHCAVKKMAFDVITVIDPEISNPKVTVLFFVRLIILRKMFYSKLQSSKLLLF